MLRIPSPVANVTALSPVDAHLEELDRWSLQDIGGDLLLKAALQEVFRETDVEDAYALRTVPSSMHLLDTSEFKDTIRFGKDMRIHRSLQPAGGVLLKPKEACVAVSPDPFIIASSSAHMAVVNAPLDKLVRKEAVLGTLAPGEPVGIVEAVVTEFWKRGVKPEDIVMTMHLVPPQEAHAHRFTSINGNDDSPEEAYWRKLDELIAKKWKSGIIHFHERHKQVDFWKLFLELARELNVRDVRLGSSVSGFAGYPEFAQGDNLIIVRRNA